MTISLNIPWHQYALIVVLAEKMQEKKRWFGKTALQKLIYLLEAIYKVPCGYEFSLYIHGPFCADLMGDLDYVNALRGVEVQYDPLSNGYKITPGEAGDTIKVRAKDFLLKYGKEIDSIMEEFGPMRARDLELRSTIVYVDRDNSASGRELTKRDFIEEIKEIKPHFTEAEIEQVFNELCEKGYIKQRV
ncbi:hypothetical protein [Neomoorella thermoacetica]|uniref:hypothetical protein n=1 Tax=Neomoorella thermoacetica TaxID=1525 RepID=UPI0008FA5987|nr:hypothetical protein [Moorella thermoacetica]OIQ10503.1 hypothetical protein MOOTH_25770 [Moorella thermoacetica]